MTDISPPYGNYERAPSVLNTRIAEFVDGATRALPRTARNIVTFIYNMPNMNAYTLAFPSDAQVGDVIEVYNVGGNTITNLYCTYAPGAVDGQGGALAGGGVRKWVYVGDIALDHARQWRAY